MTEALAAEVAELRRIAITAGQAPRILRLANILDGARERIELLEGLMRQSDEARNYDDPELLSAFYARWDQALGKEQVS